MVRALYPKDIFIPRQRQVKVKVKIRSKGYQAGVYALIDSGATDNFIAPHVVNQFQIPTYDLQETRIIRNVDGTKNSIGNVSRAVNLKIRHNDIETTQCFMIINLGSDSILLGYPFLAANNPQIDWSNGTFKG